MTYDYVIKESEFYTEDLEVIYTHLRNYNDDYEFDEDNEEIIVHCKSETEYCDLEDLITKIRQR